jgi:ABC-type spermidine/putrescine transport system permease subunit I
MGGALEPRDRALLRQTRTAFLLLAPAGFLLVFLFVWPELGMLAVSLRAPAWSAANYAHFLGDSYYIGVLLRSLLLGLFVTAVTLALGLPLAYWLSRITQR